MDIKNKKMFLNCLIEDELFQIPFVLDLIPFDAKSSIFFITELIEIAKSHPAFEIDSNLSILEKLYKVKIIFLPKFHCELSQIEGLWAQEIEFLSKNIDQKFPTGKSRKNL